MTIKEKLIQNGYKYYYLNDQRQMVAFKTREEAEKDLKLSQEVCPQLLWKNAKIEAL